MEGVSQGWGLQGQTSCWDGAARKSRVDLLLNKYGWDGSDYQAIVPGLSPSEQRKQFTRLENSNSISPFKKNGLEFLTCQRVLFTEKARLINRGVMVADFSHRKLVTQFVVTDKLILTRRNEKKNHCILVQNETGSSLYSITNLCVIQAPLDSSDCFPYSK